MSICSKDIERKRDSVLNQGPKHWYKCPKMLCNNPNLDNVNINGHTKVKFYKVVLKILSRNEIMMDGRTK